MADRLRILVTNDDGIHSPGIEALYRIANEITDDVWVVAPESEQSGASHSLTLTDPLRLRQLDERWFAVRGTPTDCVLMGLKKVLPGPADLGLSGINRGQNLAEDVTYSGTVAAAMEGTALGVRSIAFSQAYGIESTGGPLRWETAETHGAELVRKLLKAHWGPGVLVNVNFPDCDPHEVAGIEVTRQGKRDEDMVVLDEREDARGNPYYWIGFSRRRSEAAQGTDLKAIYERRISVTPLHLDLTQAESLPTLKSVIDG